ncbi:MAG: ABC transporter permease [Anaerolineae bacterium]
MKAILLVAGQELVVNLRRPGYIIMTLLIPALGGLALLVGSLFGGEVGEFFKTQFAPGQKAMGYVDYSGLLTADRSAYMDKFIPYADEASARAALLAKEIDGYFVLPTDYLQTGRVIVYGLGGGFSTFVDADEGELRHFLVDQLLTGRVEAAIQERIREPMRVEPITLSEKGEVSTESPFSWIGDFVVPYLFSILFIITLFTTSGFLLEGVSEEKEGRIIEILLSSIKPTQLLAGKILGLGAVGLIQVAVWISAGAALLGAAVALFTLTGVINLSPGTMILGLIYFVLGYLLYATLFAVAGSMGTTQRESQQIAGIFSLAAAIPWMTISFMFTNPNAPLTVVLSYIPFTSPVMMVLRLGFGRIPTGQIVISLALLGVSIVLTLWAGAKIFRVGLLMYGKRPNLKDLARAFKEA